MTRNDINSLIYFCERKFGTTNIPFVTVINELQHEADNYHTSIEDILQYEYIQHEEMNKELQYLEQQEEDERDYVDNYNKWL